MNTDTVGQNQRYTRRIRPMLRRKWLWMVLVLLYTTPIANAIDGPIIDIWYGEQQSFGRLGRPQPWCNIVGNVSGLQGIHSLAYTLNQGPRVELSLGPDGRRLSRAGDFNIDLACQELDDGHNDVEIHAEALDAQTSTAMIAVDYISDTVWPLPYVVDWRLVDQIGDVAEIVDGKWSLEDGWVRTLEPGYDRILAIGDRLWGDYEVETSFIVHAIPGGSYGVGVVVHWNGHTDDPVAGWQPKTGWRPVGALGWYRGGALRIEDGDRDLVADESVNLELEVLYRMKMQVESPPGEPTFYRLKMWKASEVEPSAWDLEAPGRPHHPTTGSVLLLGHRVDVSFGGVSVVPIGLEAPPQPVEIRDVQVAMGDTEAMVTWTTNHRATSRVDYGPTLQYEDGHVEDQRFVTRHQMTLTGLTPETPYHFQVSSISIQGEPGTAPDDVFTTTGGGPRATLGLQALYTFNAGDGDTIFDDSGVEPGIDLTIADREAVTWITGGGLRLNAPTLAQSDGSVRRLHRAIQDRQSLTVEAWVQPVLVAQGEPARLVTMSSDALNRNVTLDQHAAGYEVRLRTSLTMPEGRLALRADLEVPVMPTLQHVVFTRDEDGTTALYLDGQVVSTSQISGDFSTWDQRMPLVLGNEATGDHPWLGDVYLVAIYNRALGSHEVRQHFLTVPASASQPDEPVGGAQY